MWILNEKQVTCCTKVFCCFSTLFLLAFLRPSQGFRWCVVFVRRYISNEECLVLMPCICTLQFQAVLYIIYSELLFGNSYLNSKCAFKNTQFLFKDLSNSIYCIFLLIVDVVLSTYGLIHVTFTFFVNFSHFCCSKVIEFLQRN